MTHTYDDIRATIETLRGRCRDINDGTAKAAVEFTRVLEFSGARPPQIFWHGGDALVFTWSGDGRQSCYITVTDEDVGQALYLPKSTTDATIPASNSR